jgi:uncharacterized membrane protein
MQKLQHLLEDLRSSLWFLPMLILTGAVLLAVILVEVDSYVISERLTGRWPRLFGAGAEGSRGLLSAIAGSMITVAGVTFSITVVALALASNQYSSRILQNFMRDRANQTVLGVFVGVFAYCLVVLRTVRGGDEGGFVPSVAVLVALLLAFAAIGFLIYFIHHIAASIQATSIIEAAAAETIHAIDRLFPAADASDRENDTSSAGLTALPWMAVPARKTGYVRGVDADALVEVARTQNAVVRMETGIGDFVIEGSALTSLAGRQPDDESIRKLNAAYVVGRDRTVHQDAAYGIRQIVDVALKALSPGINDSTTAINCVDHLGAILARLAPRPVGTPHRYDGDELRLITRGPTFEGLLAEAFEQIRRNAEGNVTVLSHLIRVLGVIATRTTDGPRRQALRRLADLVAETAERSVPAPHDRADVLAIRDQVFPREASTRDL